jgi:type IV/VI secretion system ImpK/VasF family protein
MKLPELVNPAFLFAVALRRKIKRNFPLDYGTVKREALGMFAKLEAQAAASSLTDRWNRAKVPLTYLIDEIAIMEPWPGAEMWNDHSLEIEYLGHTEKMRGVWFYDRECAFAMEHADVELLEIIYCCMCLGFEGKYRGQTTQLKNHMDNLFAHLRVPQQEENEKLFPKAYTVDLTANDPRIPMRLVTAAVIALAIPLVFVIVGNALYKTFVGDLQKLVNELYASAGG